MSLETFHLDTGVMIQRNLMTCLSLMIILTGSSLNAQSPSVASELRAGTAKVEITPAADVAVDILGKPLQLRDPLYARPGPQERPGFAGDHLGRRDCLRVTKSDCRGQVTLET